MNNITISKKDQIVMTLVHYFVTKENYSPIVVKGAKDEIWLENLDGPYKIIRINTGYIHNEEQFDYDILKTKHVLKQIKKKTLTFKMNALNICLDLADRVKIKENKNVDTVSLTSYQEIRENENLKSIFPAITTELIDNATDLDLFINVTNDVNSKTEKDNEIYNKIFKEKKIIMTYVFIAISSIMFLLMYLIGDGSTFVHTLLEFGGNNIDLVRGGQVYRLLTSVFLHIGIIHFFVNMYSLKIVGTQLEKFIGKWKFLAIYLISGIVGSMLSLVMNQDVLVSVGASGAIFGILGALLYFGNTFRVYLNDVLRKQILPIIILNLAVGFMIEGIDNAAHIGGLIAGYLAAMIFSIEGKNNKSDIIKSSIALLVFVGFLAYMIFR